jgi:choline dehydrogenase-like flavoprotein
VRGSDSDYDDWADLIDDTRWSTANIKKYMRKHQTLEPIDPAIIDRTTIPFVGENHGTDGPVRTSFNDWRMLIDDAVIKACDQVTGYTKKPIDPWSGDHLGFFNTLGSVARTGPNRGKRSYAARGYFEPNRGRPNLTVLCDASVNKVILEGTTATGVSFTYKGHTHEIKAKKEVLVCGGVIQSPQILELSGIGDPEVLKKAGVECKVELPEVGENFQDHVAAIAGYDLVEGVKSLDEFRTMKGLGQVAEILQTTGGG